jgi:crotonobetainyl-CoA:carnitine CoA-transferase CaiB-like acyl-CoA transferase
MASEGGPERLPLDGVRVVDLTVAWAGPYATQLLAEWGAEVIRVEPRTRIQPTTRSFEAPAPPEVQRQVLASGQTMGGYPDLDAGEDPWNRGSSFNSHARNKLSMTADITRPQGREAFLRLVEVSDVVVENNVPETIEKTGLTYEQLVERNPRLIMLRMPAFGLSGPYKNYRAYGTHIEAMVGHHYIRNYPDAMLEAAGDVFTGDAVNGINGALGVAMALRHRQRSGLGQLIELPQAEAFLPMLGDFILDYSVNGRDEGAQGNAHRSHAPHNYYPCAGDDSWIGIDCDSDGAWQAICEVLGAADLAQDPRFRSGVERFERRRELDEALAGHTRRHDAQALFLSLQAAGVIAAPVQNEAAAYACPQLAERGFFEAVTSPNTGTHAYPGLIFRMARTPNAIRRASPDLGEDSDYVYREVMGYGEAEYGALLDSGDAGLNYAPGVVPWQPGEDPGAGRAK